MPTRTTLAGLAVPAIALMLAAALPASASHGDGGGGGVRAHDGSASAHGTGSTHGASGSFSVERRMTDLAGSDHVAFRAVRRGTGAVCRGHDLL